MAKVSVIIPFHNVEKYIGKCLESVVSQTLSDIELILVNDASDDMSRNIAADYAARDSRIKIIDIPVKSGQGFARNAAFDVASGDYIGFVDSDDIVDVTFFEKLYNRAEETKSDIVMCGANLLDDKTGVLSSDDYYSLASLKEFFLKVFSPQDVKDEILNINVVLWNKIYNRNFFNASGVKFVPGYIYEDLPFFFETFLKADKISIVPEKLYTYRQNRVCSTMQNSDKKVYDRIPMVQRTYDVLSSTDFLAGKKVDIAAWVIDDIFHRYTVLEDKYYEDYYPAMKDLFSIISLSEEEKSKLASISYCFDEYCAVLNSTYYGFWKFLIEKYKTSNQRIRLAEHKCNLDIKAVKDYLEDYKKQVIQEKNEINAFWQNRLDEEKGNFFSELQKNKEDYEKCVADLTDRFDSEKKDLVQFSKNRIKNLCAAVKYKLQEEEKKLEEEKRFHVEDVINVKNEESYKYNKMKTIDLKNQAVELKMHYSKIIKKREIYYMNAMRKQKDYYENRYLPVKIVMKLCRTAEQFKNKYKRLLKTN